MKTNYSYQLCIAVAFRDGEGHTIRAMLASSQEV